MGWWRIAGWKDSAGLKDSAGWKDIAFRLSALLRRRQWEDELDEELRFHLEMEIERRMAGGQSRAEATRAARLDFGAPESVKEQVRDAWGTRLADETGRDVRGALRLFLAAPAMSAVAVGSLAVGLATATVIFSLADAVMLRPLPFGDPQELVSLEEVTPEGLPFSVSVENLLSFDRQSRSLEGVAARTYMPARPALGAGSSRQTVVADAVTPSFFSVLGVDARLGRTFDPDPSRADEATREVVLSDHGWRHLFGADPDIVGREIDLDGELWTVIGVLPENFRFGSADQDAFLPFLVRESDQRGNRYLMAIARLSSGSTLEQARQELRSIASGLEERYPDSNAGWGVRLKPLDHFLLGDQTRRAHGVLLGAAALLLLLACVNVSTLLLARSADRRDEIQLRLNLGASLGRLRRQMLVESLVLAGVGGVCALGLAALALPRVRGLDVALPRLDQVSLDSRSLIFLLLATALSGLFFGLASALSATKSGDGGALRARRQGSERGTRRLRSALVMAEVALAMVLTVGAGLLLRSFEQLRAFDSGFDSAGVLLARVNLPAERYAEGGGQFFQRLVEYLETLPGVQAVGGTSVQPFLDGGTENVVGLETDVDRSAFRPVHWRSVTPDYFEAVGIPLRQGRTIDPNARRLETVISASLAERLWPDGDAIGQRLRWRIPEGPLLEVVGIVGDVEDLELGGGNRAAMVYWPQRAMGWLDMTLALRTDLDPAALSSAVRDAIREIDPLLAAPELSTLSGRRVEALSRPLLVVRILAFAAAIALLLATAGVYGMVAYSVRQRRRELGVRAAIGARPVELVKLVIVHAGALVAGGLAGGLLITFSLVETLRVLLYETSPLEPQVLVFATLLLLVVGLVASGLPALRTLRIDPVTVLRED